MNLLILGEGGREHALAQTLNNSPLVTKVFVAPGNEGMSLDEGVELLPLSSDLTDEEFCEAVVSLVKEHNIHLTIVGSESYLEQSLVDYFQEYQLKIVGPTRRAAQIELSKEFAKIIMKLANIPTAEFELYTNYKDSLDYLENYDWSKGGRVLKAIGPAQGKGVYMCYTLKDALTALELLQDSELFPILIEEVLTGKEVSYFALCDGKEFRTLGMACDYKQLLTGGKGPNTGGMGAYSPVPWITDEQRQQIEKDIVKPLLTIMKSQGFPFAGLLFVGLIFTDKGPKVLEFNARLGDPETQAILPLIDEDLVPWLLAISEGRLHDLPHRPIKMRPLSAVHVVLAAEGYPENRRNNRFVKKGVTLKPQFTRDERHHLFYAGVKLNTQSGNHSLLETAGGRVMGITVMAEDLQSARSDAYQKVKEVTFPGAQMREDIGL